MTPTVINVTGPSRVPYSCSLPLAEQPARLADFDDLFARSVLAVERIGAIVLVLELDPAAAARAADLTARESACCSFFGFELRQDSGGAVSLEITVPPSHTAVLDDLADRARSAADQRSR